MSHSIDHAAAPRFVSFRDEWLSSPARMLVEMMYEADDGNLTAELAAQAVYVDPGCVDALAVVGWYSERCDEKLAYLTAAVGRGDEQWTGITERHGYDVTWWDEARTRPYMRAIHWLGRAYAEAGNPEAARFCFERLLTMNPNDDQGVRSDLDQLEIAHVPIMRM